MNTTSPAINVFGLDAGEDALPINPRGTPEPVLDNADVDEDAEEVHAETTTADVDDGTRVDAEDVAHEPTLDVSKGELGTDDDAHSDDEAHTPVAAVRTATVTGMEDEGDSAEVPAATGGELLLPVERTMGAVDEVGVALISVDDVEGDMASVGEDVDATRAAVVAGMEDEGACDVVGDEVDSAEELVTA